MSDRLNNNKWSECTFLCCKTRWAEVKNKNRLTTWKIKRKQLLLYLLMLMKVAAFCSYSLHFFSLNFWIVDQIKSMLFFLIAVDAPKFLHSLFLVVSQLCERTDHYQIHINEEENCYYGSKLSWLCCFDVKIIRKAIIDSMCAAQINLIISLIETTSLSFVAKVVQWMHHQRSIKETDIQKKTENT